MLKQILEELLKFEEPFKAILEQLRDLEIPVDTLFDLLRQWFELLP